MIAAIVENSTRNRGRWDVELKVDLRPNPILIYQQLSHNQMKSLSIYDPLNKITADWLSMFTVRHAPDVVTRGRQINIR